MHMVVKIAHHHLHLPPLCAVYCTSPHMVVEKQYYHETVPSLYVPETNIASHGSKHKRPPFAINHSRVTYNEDCLTWW